MVNKYRMHVNKNCLGFPWYWVTTTYKNYSSACQRQKKKKEFEVVCINSSEKNSFQTITLRNVYMNII